MTQQPKYQYPTSTAAPPTVEGYTFEPIQGYSVLHWQGKHPFTSTHYTITEHQTTEDYTVALVKLSPPGAGGYQVHAVPDLVVHQADVSPAAVAAKSFHLDPYCFDSRPERTLFWDLPREGRVQKLYFTGMLTHGQSDFYIQYIDPDSHTVRSYYPDFLAQKDDGSYVIIEVKGDNYVDTAVVQAKQTFAQQMAVASGMSYEMIKASEANAGRYGVVLDRAGGRAEQVGL